jgi:hypothetical protein
VGTGTKEDESSIGYVWAAGFHHVMARSKPQILNLQIWEHTCINKFHILHTMYLYVFYTAKSRQQLYPSALLIAQPVHRKYNVLSVRQEINLK